MKNISRKISYLLRHNPEDLKMDKQGWVYICQLIEKLNIPLSVLEEIVEKNDKKRFSFDTNKIKIRANQGHSNSLNLDIMFKEVQYTKTYYHGTNKINIESILNNGLTPKSRAYVHLSKDKETAENVGLRHGKDVVILSIDDNKMKKDGKKIYESENGVILADYISPKYIQLWKK